MQFSVPERISLTQQHTAEESFQINGRFGYAFLKIVVIGTDQCIPEVPRVLGKHIINHVESHRFQVLYHKYRCGPGVPFAESVYLP